MKIFIQTFGCRTNIYDTALIKAYINDDNIELTSENSADTIIVNSCSVTNSADAQCRNYIRKMNKLGKRVILTGCGANLLGKKLFEDGEIFGVFSMGLKSQIGEILYSNQPFFKITGTNFKDEKPLKTFSAHTKAFVKIEEGCDFSCSYCIIPHLRGKARSISESKILNEVEILAQNGFSEIVLTGTNIGSYGKDSGSNLARLLKKISIINGIKRIRLGSLEPSQIDDEFKEILGEIWLEKHLHIALQHTSQKMLNIMRRRNKALKDIELFEFLSKKGFALGTDFIVGHPGESEEIWLEALENFKKFPLTHIHAFVYSKRDNTHSATMKNDVSGDVAKKRLKILQSIVLENSLKFRNANKRPLNVLVEQFKNGFYEGYDEFYVKMRLKSSINLTKQWIKVENYVIKNDGNFAEF